MRFYISVFIVFVTSFVANAGIIPVTSLVDGEAGSLRNAINETTDYDTILVDPAIADDTFHIMLAPLEIRKGMVIIGNGLTISGDSLYQVFNISTPKEVYLIDLQITQGVGGSEGGGIHAEDVGLLHIENCDVSYCYGAQRGAGIRAHNTNLVLKSNRIHHNEIHLGGRGNRDGGAGLSWYEDEGQTLRAIGNILDSNELHSYTYQGNTMVNGAGMLVFAGGQSNNVSALIVKENIFKNNRITAINSSQYFPNIGGAGFAIDYERYNDTSFVLNNVCIGNQVFVTKGDGSGFPKSRGGGALIWSDYFLGGVDYHSLMNIEGNSFEGNQLTSDGTVYGGGLGLFWDDWDEFYDMNFNIVGNEFVGNKVKSFFGDSFGGGIATNQLYCGLLTVNLNIVSGNLLENDSATAKGGGMFLDLKQGILSENEIYDNEVNAPNGAYGGGLYINGEVSTSSVRVSSNHIYNNVVLSQGTAGGGGLCSNPIEDYRYSLFIDNNLIQGNSVVAGANVFGGGLHLISRISEYKIQNNQIVNNSIETTGNGNMSAKGGGMYYDRAYQAYSLDNKDNVFENNTVQANGIAAGGGEYFLTYINPNQGFVNDISQNKYLQNSCTSDSASAWGGGLAIDVRYYGSSSSATINVSRSFFERNSVSSKSKESYGAGLAFTGPNNFDSAPGLFVDHNSFLNNSCGSELFGNHQKSFGGAACFVTGAPIKIEFVSNTVAENHLYGDTVLGSGIYFKQVNSRSIKTQFQLTNNTIYKNYDIPMGDSVVSLGGGLFTDLNLVGNNTWVILSSNSIVGNTISGDGGGFYCHGIDSTSSVRYSGNLIGMNSAQRDDNISIDSSRHFSDGNNLIVDASGALKVFVPGYPNFHLDYVGDSIAPIDLLLDSLRDNGGPTKTLALLEGSPGIDLGNAQLVLTDQRAYQKVGVRDIGAFEFGAQPEGQIQVMYKAQLLTNGAEILVDACEVGIDEFAIINSGTGSLFLKYEGIIITGPNSNEIKVKSYPSFVIEEGDTSWFKLEMINPTTEFNIEVEILADVLSGSFSFNISGAAADIMPPSLITYNDTVYLNDTGMVFLEKEKYIALAEDNCGFDYLRLHSPSLSCWDLGWNTVGIELLDVSNNRLDTSLQVLVLDTISPVLKVRDTVMYLKSGEFVYFEQDELLVASHDNCELSENIEISQNVYGHINLGVNVANTTIYDRSGNSTTQFSYVVINDSSLIAKAKDLQIMLIDGYAQIEGIALDNGSYSAGSNIISYQLSQSEFTCEDVGLNRVILTVVNDQGLSSSAVANVVVFPEVFKEDLTCRGSQDGRIWLGCSQDKVAYKLHWPYNAYQYESDRRLWEGLDGNRTFCLKAKIEDVEYTVVCLEVDDPYYWIDVVSRTPVTCPQDSDGVVVIAGGGDNGPFEYSIDGVNYQDGVFSGLKDEIYNFRMRNANGCIETESARPGRPDELHGTTYWVHDAKCDMLGEIRYQMYNGRSPISISFLNSAGDTIKENLQFYVNTPRVITGFPPDIYYLHMVDNYGCPGYDFIEIEDEPSDLQIQVDQIVPEINGSDGVIRISRLTGGNPPFRLGLWDTTALILKEYTNGYIDSLEVGEYVVGVLDVNECLDTAHVTVGNEVGIRNEVHIQVEVYPVPSKGLVRVSTDGVVGPISYLISNDLGQTVQVGAYDNPILNLDLTSFAKGIYFIQLTGKEGVIERKKIILN